MTVGELLARTTSEELTEWMAYEHLAGPLGPERDDILHGIRTAALVNVHRGRGRKARPQDFIPQWAGKERQDWTEMLAAVQTLNRSMGGADLREGAEDVGPRGTAGRDRPGRRRPGR